jgi:hypothetical protein
MIELQSNDWFSITGRPGVVFTFEAGKLPPELTHPRDMVNTIILVNGLPAEVKSVEHYAIHCPRPDSRCEHPFGLLVTPTSWVKVRDE